MNKFVLGCLLICLAFAPQAQDLTQAKYELYEIQFDAAIGSDDFETANLYLDSLSFLDEECFWEAQYLRAELYSSYDDSMNQALVLVDTSIVYYTTEKDTSMLAELYDLKHYILSSRFQHQESIQCLNKGLELSYSSKDSTNIGFFEAKIGSYYLMMFKDSPSDLDKAFEHLEKATSIATQAQDWWQAAQTQGYLELYYSTINRPIEAERSADLAVLYSLNLDSLDSDRYDGYFTRARHYIRTEQYLLAIQDALIAFKNAKLLDDYDLLQMSSCMLTEAYWKNKQLENAYVYANIALEIMGERNNFHSFHQHYYWSSKIFEAKGFHQEALLFLHRFHEYQKEDFDRAQVQASARAMYHGQLERQELEQAQVELQLELTQTQSQFKSVALSAALLILLLVLSYSWLLRQKRKKEQELHQILAASHEVVLNQKEMLIENIEVLQKDLEAARDTDAFYFTQSAIQIKFQDIIYLESSNNYVLIHTVDRQTPLLERIKMIELVKYFPDAFFVKIHRSYYINTNHIIARPSKYRVQMSNGTLLNASRSYVSNLGDKFLKKKEDTKE